MCFVRISEQTANFALQNIKRSVFVTEVESVYCAVRTESLYITDTFRLYKVNEVVFAVEKGVFAVENSAFYVRLNRLGPSRPSTVQWFHSSIPSSKRR